MDLSTAATAILDGTVDAVADERTRRFLALVSADVDRMRSILRPNPMTVRTAIMWRLGSTDSVVRAAVGVTLTPDELAGVAEYRADADRADRRAAAAETRAAVFPADASGKRGARR